MSMRTIARSSSNRNSASALQSSVLPTPVGPRNRNEPYGRFGSPRPARWRRIASETRRTASSCPTTRRCSASSMSSSFSRSPCIIFETGMPVAQEPRLRFPLLLGSGLGLLHLCFELRELPVLELRDLVELAFALEPRDVRLELVDLFLDVCAALHLCLLGLPDFLELGVLAFEVL